jgi:hypothetical protein
VGQLDTDHQALDVQVLGREVVLLGPRVAIALSAAAAAETARRLAEAAAEALAAESNFRQDGQHLTLLPQASHTLPREE